MASDDIRSLLKSGIEAARSGNKILAERIFREVIDLDSQNELAWMWLASVLESPAERERALQHVLSINPANERALQLIEKIRAGRRTTPESPPAPPPRPSAPQPPPPLASSEEAEDLLSQRLGGQPVSPEPPRGEPVRTTARPSPLSRPAPPRAGGISAPLYYGGIALAVLLIGAAILLLMLQPQDDDETTQAPPTLVRPRGTLTPTPIPPPPTATPRPRNTLSPENLVVEGNLPPTWTPSPTNTLLPTDTPTPEPSNPAQFELVFAGGQPSQLWLIGGDGSNLREQVIDFSQITSISESTTPDLLDPAFSPDGQFIALTIQTSPTTQEIFILHLQSNRLRQLTTLGSRITDGASWSNDGKFIAFSAASNVAGLGENQDIYVIDVDTGALTNITNGIGQNRQPAWSPVSSQLVFASDRETPTELEIWLLGAIGGTPERLTSAVRSSFSPAFSADGSKIAFISDRGGDNDLYIMNADGTDERLLAIDDNEADDLDPAWSPDSTWIVVSSTRGGSPVLQLWLVNPITEEWRQVSNTQIASRYADWRPVQ